MPLVRLLGETLRTASGQQLCTREALAGASAVGLYFSAGWCPPCQGFTPQLSASYERSLAAKGFRCVFVSSDRDEPSFESYHAKMPWLALPYADRKRSEQLFQRFFVQTIPTLALVDARGETITTEGRDAVVQDPEGLQYPWRAPLVRDLADGQVGQINSMPSLILLCENADLEAQERARAALSVVATEVCERGRYALFLASGGQLTEQIRALVGLRDSQEPQLVFLDIPNELSFYVGRSGAGALEAEAMREMLEQFEKGALERKRLPPPS